jgi:hypothetical protein
MISLNNKQSDARSPRLSVMRMMLLFVLLVPGGIAALSGFLFAVNGFYGYLRLGLWPPFLYAFVLIGLASPVVGIVTLITAACLQGSDSQYASKRSVIVLSVAAIFSPLLWGTIVIYLFFLAGGSR